MAGLSLVPPSASIDAEAQLDKFWRTVAEAAGEAITAVDPRHPDLDLMQSVVRHCRVAAGLPPLHLTGLGPTSDRGA